MPDSILTKDYFDEQLSSKIDEVLHTVKDGFDDLSDQIGGLRTETSSLRTETTSLRAEVEGLKKEVVQIRAIMVDKDYLDKKIAELRGEIVLSVRREDAKADLLIDILKERRVLKDSDVVRLKEIVVFPVFRE